MPSARSHWKVWGAGPAPWDQFQVAPAVWVSPMTPTNQRGLVASLVASDTGVVRSSEKCVSEPGPALVE